MFLHYILIRPENDLLSMVFWAQEKSPVKNDWALQVKEDMREIGLDLTYEDIKALSKESFKKLVKAKCKALAFTNLMKEKEGKKKMNGIYYSELLTQDYLLSKEMTTSQKKIIFKIRTKSVPTIWGSIVCAHCALYHVTK